MSVLKLADFRKPPKMKAPTGPRQFCTACESDQFFMLEDKTIVCGCCFRNINNLRWELK